jgi:hypothetical protein
MTGIGQLVGFQTGVLAQFTARNVERIMLPAFAPVSLAVPIAALHRVTKRFDQVQPAVSFDRQMTTKSGFSTTL